MPKEKNKEKALSALLQTSSVKDAAKKCGLSEETLYRYLKEPEFNAEYRASRRLLVENSIARIQGLTGQALETLARNLHCENPSVEVRAAQILIDNAIRGVEITDILERLEALENEHQSKN